MRIWGLRGVNCNRRRQIYRNFFCFRTTSLDSCNQRESFFNTLSGRHQRFLATYRDNLNRIRDAIDVNYDVIKQILSTTDHIFVNENCYYQDRNDVVKAIRGHDIEKVCQGFHCYDCQNKSSFPKVQVTLKQIARDWSSDGEQEREQCYKPIVDEVLRQFDPDKIDPNQVKILVPGAGLGRLLYELAFEGYHCEGNEFSFFMLITSNFILNRCDISNQHKLYPFVHQYVNNLNRGDQTKSITFPDLSPTQRPPTKGIMKMVAGDFLEVYHEEDSWDCVATCFFIDCANNIIEFIENIYK